MKLTSLAAPMSALVVLSCLALPAFAEQRRAPTGRASGQAVARVAPRGGGGPGRVSPGPVAAGQRGSRPPVRHAAPPRVAVPRGAAPYRSYAPRPPYAYARPYYRPYSYGYPYRYARAYPYAVYARPYYYRAPYYAFRPRISIGFGVWVGYPIAFPYYGYGYGYGYGYDYGYGYGAPYVAPYGVYGYRVAPPVDVGVVPGAAAHGGVSFELSPADAEVFVDGAFAGTVDDFTPNRRPLVLTPGLHHIEVQAPGFETLVLDITVVAGEVTPYRGALQPVRP